MQIQTVTSSPIRPAAARSNTPAPTPEPQDPQDGANINWKQEAIEVGKSGLRGAMDGIGWSFLAFMAQSAGGPAVGLAARAAIMGVGAAIAVKERSGQFEQITGSPTLGKIMAGVSGASRNLLMMGMSPAASVNGAVLNGALMGGLFGVLDTPR